jgi:hypothetical protein
VVAQHDGGGPFGVVFGEPQVTCCGVAAVGSQAAGGEVEQGAGEPVAAESVAAAYDRSPSSSATSAQSGWMRMPSATWKAFSSKPQ